MMVVCVAVAVAVAVAVDLTFPVPRLPSSAINQLDLYYNAVIAGLQLSKLMSVNVPLAGEHWLRLRHSASGVPLRYGPLWV